MDEVASLAVLAFPATFSQFFTILAQSIVASFTGRYLGPDALSACSLGIRFISIFGVKVGVGMSAAIDTLCSQEHGRDHRSTRHGLYLLRCFICQFFCTIFCTILFVTAPVYFPQIFKEPIAHMAGRFVSIGTLYVFPIFLYNALCKMLQSLGLAVLPLIATVVSAICCIGLNIIFIPLGIVGSVVALSITAWIQLTAVAMLMLRNASSRHAIASSTPSWREILDAAGMKEIVLLGLPSAACVVFESLPFAAMIAFASVIGGIEASAYITVYNVIALLFTTSYGMSGAAAARIGNALGANNPRLARNLVDVSILVTLFISLVNVGFFILFSRYLFRLFTTDEGVLERSSRLVALACFTHVVDCVQFVFQGILSACGKNHIGMVLLMVNLIGISIPTAALLVFLREWGADGLLIGLSSGLLMVIPCYLFVVYRMFDFEQLARTASYSGVKRGEANADEEMDQLEPSHEETTDIRRE